MIPGPSQHGLSQTIFIKNSVCQVVIKYMPSLSWILNANKAVMICFLEFADMCQHGLSQFWHVSAKLIMYLKFYSGKFARFKFDALPDLVCGDRISSEIHWHQLCDADQTLFIEINLQVFIKFRILKWERKI